MVFSVQIQPNLVSVMAQLDTDEKVVKNVYDEKLYLTSDLEGALNYYIESYLKKEI